MKRLPFIIGLLFLGAQGVTYAQENPPYFDDIYYVPSEDAPSFSEEEDREYSREQEYQDSDRDYSGNSYNEEEGYYTRQIHRFYRPQYSFGYFSGAYGFYDPWWGMGPYWATPGVSIHFGWGNPYPYWGGYPGWGYSPYLGWGRPWGGYPYYGYYGYGGGYWPGYYHGFHDGYHAGGGYGRQVNYGPRVNHVNPRGGRAVSPGGSSSPRSGRELRQAVPMRTNPDATPGRRSAPGREPVPAQRSPNQWRSTPPSRPASPQRIQSRPPTRSQPVPPSGSRRAPSSGSFHQGSQRIQRPSTPSTPRYSAPAPRPSSGGSAPRSSGGSRSGGRR